MHEIYHIQMTESALEGVISTRALETIIKANIEQDKPLNLLVGKYHFDENGFEAAKRYVVEMDEVILESIATGQVENAWRAFGRKTHALQDYYSHTNYIALWKESNPEFELANGEPVPPLEPSYLNSDKLIAARVYYPLEALTLFPVFMPLLKRILPKDSHANMNLDSPECSPLFPLALSAATKRTEIAFKEICKKISSELGEEALQLFLDNYQA